MRERIAERVAASRDILGPQQRFLASIDGRPSPELLEFVARPAQPASVLLPIVDRPEGLSVLFTARADHLAHHPGQVAFPGGRLEADDPDAAAAALREAREEVGLDAKQAELVGELATHMTGTGFLITPFVAFVDGRFRPQPDPREVAAVFEVPLDFLLDTRNRREQYRERFGTRFRTYEYGWEQWRIWGATAAIVNAFTEIIRVNP